MPVNHTEVQFEADIERHLVDVGGWRSQPPTSYDKALCLIPRDLLDFVKASQPRAWKRFAQHRPQDADAAFAKRVADEIVARGTLDVLRKGVKDYGCKFSLAFFRPASSLNADLQELHRLNIFTVVRQLKYSEKNENNIDVVLFLNGLPLFPVELKDQLTNQDVTDAIRQYRTDRDPREPLFRLGRCLAFFAVDPSLAYFATELRGLATDFLPFNRGCDDGAGNPPSARGYATAYLWEETWARDSVLNLAERFVQFVEEKEDGKTTRLVVFARYHQLDCVRRLVADARDRGPGHSYLVQHSAGSGKSKSISWLAHQLSVLHDDTDKRVFDSIVVVSDRRVIDQQLQRDVRQFQQTRGVVENIDTTSKQLKQALEDGKTIIVTTLQKFPVIADEIGELPGKRFAVIIDEAHSSQSGESARSLKAVLAADSLEEAAAADLPEGDDLEDKIVAEMQRSRGRLPNVSFFAFTATPKAKTLEIFGERQPDDSFRAFSLYTMKQAIEEHFILDVLANYTTYRTYWSLLKKVEDDPQYDKKKAQYLLRSFVDLHEHSIEKKVTIMLDHFTEKVAAQIKGKAKAMIVTRSRLHAVRYALEVRRQITERGLPFKALVAFSGTVRDGGVDYTEAFMNGVPESRTAETFKGGDYRIMVVAYKFQTGFDQPLLHTMYVDKKLGGVDAVQTLSRLNRIHEDKTDTMVLDFANEADEIEKAFEPYFKTTILSEATDPHLLYQLETKLAAFHFYGEDDVEEFAVAYFEGQSQGSLHALLDPIAKEFAQASDVDQADFRSALAHYVRTYAFIAQVLTFEDVGLEKLYQFARFLLRRLPSARNRLPWEVQEAIDLESLRVQETGKHILKPAGGATLRPAGAEPGADLPVEQIEPLSQIIRELNDRFGTEFSDDDKVFIEQLEECIDASETLRNAVNISSSDNARLAFDEFVNDAIQRMIDTNFAFYKRITDNPEFGDWLMYRLFERYRERMAE